MKSLSLLTVLLAGLPLITSWAQERPASAVGNPSALLVPNADDEVEGVIMSKNTLYAPDSEGSQMAVYQTLDIYSPEENLDGRLPIVLFLHGGGWVAGDKKSVRDQGIFFARKGYVFVSANYRLAPGVHHPSQVEDVLAAIAWLQEHGHDFGGDAHRVFLMGHSSGAHLAALASTDAPRAEKAGVKREGIIGTILLDGAGYDLVKRLATLPAEEAKFKAMAEAAFGTEPEALKDASPITHIVKGTTYPHVLAVHDATRAASKEQAGLLIKALADADGKGEAVAAEGKTHETVLSDIGKDKDVVTEKILAFLKAESDASDKKASGH